MVRSPTVVCARVSEWFGPTRPKGRVPSRVVVGVSAHTTAPRPVCPCAHQASKGRGLLRCTLYSPHDYRDRGTPAQCRRLGLVFVGLASPNGCLASSRQSYAALPRAFGSLFQSGITSSKAPFAAGQTQRSPVYFAPRPPRPGTVCTIEAPPF